MLKPQHVGRRWPIPWLLLPPTLMVLTRLSVQDKKVFAFHEEWINYATCASSLLTNARTGNILWYIQKQIQPHKCTKHQSKEKFLDTLKQCEKHYSYHWYRNFVVYRHCLSTGNKAITLNVAIFFYHFDGLVQACNLSIDLLCLKTSLLPATFARCNLHGVDHRELHTRLTVSLNLLIRVPLDIFRSH